MLHRSCKTAELCCNWLAVPYLARTLCHVLTAALLPVLEANVAEVTTAHSGRSVNAAASIQLPGDLQVMFQQGLCEAQVAGLQRIENAQMLTAGLADPRRMATEVSVTDPAGPQIYPPTKLRRSDIASGIVPLGF